MLYKDVCVDAYVGVAKTAWITSIKSQPISHPTHLAMEGPVFLSRRTALQDSWSTQLTSRKENWWWVWRGAGCGRREGELKEWTIFHEVCKYTFLLHEVPRSTMKIHIDSHSTILPAFISPLSRRVKKLNIQSWYNVASKDWGPSPSWCYIEQTSYLNNTLMDSQKSQ